MISFSIAKHLLWFVKTFFNLFFLINEFSRLLLGFHFSYDRQNGFYKL
jgi:hypothetical protein